MRIAIFGSAFNPPHAGHVMAIHTLARRHDLVYVVPAFRHAFGKQMVDYDVRRHLLELSLAEFLPARDKNVIVCDIERELAGAKAPSEPIYSIEVLDAVRARFPDAVILLGVGPDNAQPETFAKFKDSERILREYGLDVVEETLGFRSTDCRQKIAELVAEDGNPPDAWITLMGKQVAGEIARQGLFAKSEILSDQHLSAPSGADHRRPKIFQG